jgi:2',3'-cyclic-nucleotide 2'-phosphodiesterase (5'-nucleotidase family)
VRVLEVVTTNDLHGTIEPVLVAGESPFLMGGMEHVAGWIDRLRAETPGRTLVLDGGDCFQGPLPVNASEGRLCARFFDLAGHDALTLGNHDFDYVDCGPEPLDRPADNPLCALESAYDGARTPLVCSNVEPRPRNVRPWIIMDRAGVRVGITGVVTPDTVRLSPVGSRGMTFIDPGTAVRAVLPEMRAAGAEVIIVMAHMEGDCGSVPDPEQPSRCRVGAELGLMADAFEPGEVDLIVAGHSHSRVVASGNVVPVVEAGEHGRWLGRARIKVRRYGGEREVSVELLPLLPVCVDPGSGMPETGACAGRPAAPGHAGVRALVAEAEASVADVCAEILGQARDDLRHVRARESPLANLAADLLRRAAADADLAVVNLGGVRGDLARGPISACDLYRVFPYDDRPQMVTVTGADLARLFEWLEAARLAGKGVSGLALSGFSLEILANGTAVLRDESGRALDPGRGYRVATSAYVLDSGRYGPVLVEAAGESRTPLSFPSVRDALASVIREMGEVEAPGLGRVQ